MGELSQARPIQQYSAEDAPKGVLRHVMPVARYPRVILEHRWLIANFFRRELLGRFRGSALGVVWVLIQPLFLFAIYYTVFGVLLGPWKLGEPASASFAIFLFSGIIAFNALLEGTTRACTVVVDNGNLVKKVAFPSELLPVPVVLGMAWFFLTPVFWPPDMAVSKLGLDGTGLFALNPAYPLLQCHRLALGVVDTEQFLLGSFWPQLGTAAMWAAFFLLLGYASFMSRRHKFADLV